MIGIPTATSPRGLEAHEDLRGAAPFADLGKRGEVSYELRAGRINVWVVARYDDCDLLALRSGVGAAIEGDPTLTVEAGEHICEWRTAIGAVRLKFSFPKAAALAIRCTTAFLPSRDVQLSPDLRDVFGAQGATGAVHTMQRGLRTGTFYASYDAPHPATLLYVQDFSELTDVFEATKTSPSDTVGGNLEEGGFLPPFGAPCVLPSSREFVVSNLYAAIVPTRSTASKEIIGRYLDLLADVYLALSRPPEKYHDWPDRARRALGDLFTSPSCTYERAGQRYMMPYVGDDTKPPESMVQLTMLVNTIEYEAWRGAVSPLSSMLLDGFEPFFDATVGCVVRWLPGEAFGETSEENMNHDAMDSWYLYHSLFNIARLATLGNQTARDTLQQSLPYAIRVARRFNYRWPIFFSLRTLDIVRAESAPGKGGERDVAGLYALVMLHARELFGEAGYLHEAKRAASAIRDLGFQLDYQTNTTGFAAEAMLRLWLLEKDPIYLELSEMCMANIFDNMWLWKCDYGNARHYRTFFGLFPLHDAPYLAAYEELEAQAKFHEYLALGGRDVRPALRLLLAEYQKYSLDRAWFYYPDALPVDVIAEKSRNGRIERALSVPIEDLQDGHKRSGQVGQEIYGSGSAFVYTSRHYAVVEKLNCMVYCSYPIYDYQVTERGGSAVVVFQTGGDRRGECGLRVVPIDREKPVPTASVRTQRGSRAAPVKKSTTVEGHAAFSLAGDTRYELRLSRTKKKPTATATS